MKTALHIASIGKMRMSFIARVTACFLLLLALVSLLYQPPLWLSDSRSDREQLRYLTGRGVYVAKSIEREAQKQILIPRIIHQTYKTSITSKKELKVLQSWRVQNPLWESRFYDDEACLAFVTEEYPQWLEAYVALPLAVERADFFRYMIVLRYGGVYADIDTECGMSLDSLIQPDDSFLAGWEDEYPTAHLAVDMKFARQRQVQQWLFAATPGHPALQALCELLASMSFDPVKDMRTDALFRTGPAPFTDIVLNHALQHPLHLRGDPYRLRILPRATLGGLPSGEHGVPTWKEPNRLARHLSIGSWKALDYTNKWAVTELEWRRAFTLLRAPTEAELGLRLYPVSTLSEPPFTIMTHLIGQGDKQGNVDVEAQVTKWGTTLGPGNYLLRQSPLDVFMQAWTADKCSGQVLLDVGAGLGIYSLAAAAVGRSSQAFELAPRSLTALQASIDYNGFSSFITVRKTALGKWNEEICLDRIGAEPAINALRGYGKGVPHWPSRFCTMPASRRTGKALMLAKLDVGAIRISASGWEGWIIEGLQVTLQQSSARTLLVEIYPNLLRTCGYSLGPDHLIQRLQSWGFTNISHIGHVCMGLKAAAQRRRMPFTSLAALFVPKMRSWVYERVVTDPSFSWCHYKPRKFLSNTWFIPDAEVPELFLFRK